MWADQSVGLIQDLPGAGDVVRDIAREAQAGGTDGGSGYGCANERNADDTLHRPSRILTCPRRNYPTTTSPAV